MSFKPKLVSPEGDLIDVGISEAGGPSENKMEGKPSLGYATDKILKLGDVASSEEDGNKTDEGIQEDKIQFLTRLELGAKNQKLIPQNLYREQIESGIISRDITGDTIVGIINKADFLTISKKPSYFLALLHAYRILENKELLDHISLLESALAREDQPKHDEGGESLSGLGWFQKNENGKNTE